MEDAYPIICEECRLVTWINLHHYLNNRDAVKDDECPHCGYKIILSLWTLAENNPNNKYLQSIFDAIDFSSMRCNLREVLIE